MSKAMYHAKKTAKGFVVLLTVAGALMLPKYLYPSAKVYEMVIGWVIIIAAMVISWIIGEVIEATQSKKVFPKANVQSTKTDSDD